MVDKQILENGLKSFLSTFTSKPQNRHKAKKIRHQCAQTKAMRSPTQITLYIQTSGKFYRPKQVSRNVAACQNQWHENPIKKDGI